MSTSTYATRPREHSAPLTMHQRQSLQRVLMERTQIQHQRVAHAAAALDALSSADSPLDRATARHDLASLLEGLAEDQAALERLELGEYGVCRSCAQPIPFERLAAIPEVDLCVGCTRIR